ncbi:MAG TPA: Type 1 glutamine amidotransferase-like domain-containing protein [Bacillota bacterium]|nr:Type 1 glutamine amidotransferase-like domain-containing protein [Bacillota bacterium]
MKLVLASQGFTTPEIANAIAELAGKLLAELNVAVINEAYVGIAAGRHEGWLINELSQIAQYVKGTISFVNLRAYDLAEIKQRLEFADLIYIIGGAQLTLPQLFRETGFDTLLPELAKNKIVMGTSAGANVLGKQIEDANYWQDQYGSSEEYLANPSLSLADFNILPHFEREDHPLRTTAKLTPLLKDHPFPLYGVTDTQAVILDDDKVEFVGGEPAIFGKTA